MSQEQKQEEEQIEEKKEKSFEQGDIGNMFGEEDNEEDRLEQERLKKEERNRLVPIEVPRHKKKNDEEEDKVVEKDKPLILYHRPAAHHSLWAHLLWNSARHCVYIMDSLKIKIKGRSVLELGCGLGAPSIVAALHGARVVVATDYPEEELLEVVAHNAAKVLVCDEETQLLKEKQQEEEFDLDRMDSRIAAAVKKIRSSSGKQVSYVDRCSKLMKMVKELRLLRETTLKKKKNKTNQRRKNVSIFM